MLQTSIALDYGLAEHVFKNPKEDNIYSVFISYTCTSIIPFLLNKLYIKYV